MIKNNNALIMAGGTGGHIFPGLAVASELQQKGWNVSWLGSCGGMEQELVNKQNTNVKSDLNIALHLISVSGLRGNGALGWLKAPFTLSQAIWQALKVIKQTAPDVIVGFGGFASGPGGVAAFLTRTPLIIHEQNAVAGMTNRVLNKWSKLTLQAFPGAFSDEDKVIGSKIKTVGNPIRKSILILAEKIQENIKNEQSSRDDTNNGHSASGKLNKEPTKDKLNVLVIGGSRGALALNKKLPKVFCDLLAQNKIQVKHQVGKERLAQTKAFYTEAKCDVEQIESQDLTLVEFIDDMADALSWADVVVCRAGALTVAEIAAVGLCAVFIPYPYAVDDHQTMNAQWLVSQQAALSFNENELDGAQFKDEIERLFASNVRINQMAKNAKQVAYTDAAEVIARHCDELRKVA